VLVHVPKALRRRDGEGAGAQGSSARRGLSLATEGAEGAAAQVRFVWIQTGITRADFTQVFHTFFLCRAVPCFSVLSVCAARRGRSANGSEA